LLKELENKEIPKEVLKRLLTKEEIK
jgi:hypothetical protein